MVLEKQIFIRKSPKMNPLFHHEVSKRSQKATYNNPNLKRFKKGRETKSQTPLSMDTESHFTYEQRKY